MFLSVIEMKEKNDQYWFETSHLIGMVPSCGKWKNYEKFKCAFIQHIQMYAKGRIDFTCVLMKLSCGQHELRKMAEISSS